MYVIENQINIHNISIYIFSLSLAISIRVKIILRGLSGSTFPCPLHLQSVTSKTYNASLISSINFLFSSCLMVPSSASFSQSTWNHSSVHGQTIIAICLFLCHYIQSGFSSSLSLTALVTLTLLPVFLCSCECHSLLAILHSCSHNFHSCKYMSTSYTFSSPHYHTLHYLEQWTPNIQTFPPPSPLPPAAIL